MGDEQTTHSDYKSYLIRLRRVPQAEEHAWHVSLEEPLTQKTHHFKELTGLFAFLLEATGERALPQAERYPGMDSPGGTA